MSDSDFLTKLKHMKQEGLEKTAKAESEKKSTKKKYDAERYAKSKLSTAGENKEVTINNDGVCESEHNIASCEEKVTEKNNDGKPSNNKTRRKRRTLEDRVLTERSPTTLRNKSKSDTVGTNVDVPNNTQALPMQTQCEKEKVLVSYPKRSKGKRGGGLSEKRRLELREYERVRKANYRAELKKNPEKAQKLKDVRREESQKRRENGTLKRIRDMSEREKRCQRGKWREYKRKASTQRQILKNLNTPPASPSPENEENLQLIPEVPEIRRQPSRQAVAGKQMSRRKRDRQRKELSKTKSERDFFKKKFEFWKKKFYRNLNKSNKGKSPSPRKVVNRLLKSGSHAEVKRKLLFGEVCIRQLRRNSEECKSPEEKRAFANSVGGELYKKYKMEGELSKQSVSTDYLRLKYREKMSLLKQKRCGKAAQIRKKVMAFYEDDEALIITPGRKQTITRKKVKKQVRFLLDSVRNLHKKFVSKTKLKVSLATFSRLRPFWVIKPKMSERDTCMCVKHTNFDLKVTALRRHKVLKVKHRNDILSAVCCDTNQKACMFRECETCKSKTVQSTLEIFDPRCNKNENIFYYEWVRKAVEITNKKNEKQTKKIVCKERKKTTGGQLIKILNDDLKPFCKHVYTANHQRNFFKDTRENLSENETCIVIDWSENYGCKYSKEIQSTHFGASQQQISLHTGVAYLNQDRKIISFYTASDLNRHDPPAIWAHLSPVLNFIQCKYPAVDTIHFFSDGPTTQYRNKINFFLIAKTCFQLNFQHITWNFSEPGHGKGPADGIGGAIKRVADAAILHGHDITEAKDFQNVTANLHVTNFKISEGEIGEFDLLVPKTLIPIPKTMQIRQLTFHRDAPELVGVRYLSCRVCKEPEICQFYRIDNGRFTQPKNILGSSQSCDLSNEPSTSAEVNPHSENLSVTDENDSVNVADDIQIAEGDRVAVLFEKNWFPGQVIHTLENLTEFEVSFMDRSNDYFKWPSKPDVHHIEKDGFLCKLEAPAKFSSRMFKFCPQITESLTKKYSQ